ncbi:MULTISPECIES: MauE/DoxX family redox-associated membrane protein [unclassified Streptomyces]|uniref:MauE/DoxX family redox-associated membrane protein n=1 Tax=unclassified Streptomyces TaxID=2593676 RepID=UPI002DD83A58|nr:MULTISPECIES: MauE/DoxX family redox-associated membrane protein [unclassified Streptomyces]WSA95139.1 methylamine utilization protein MauE [Streptomyces sp. NBC_01795]WSB79561.1 methylamine utilization protein MauE [Streptomyces sp. NBC_01775]WSS12236.1 methylamine utilization protein MauE [Streptomyces sp. NBC_01186]WSS40949.1 methylamine utilization protein MauE [Streptomyces sp. NBC_01187]
MGDAVGYVLLACRLLTGGVFAVSAVSKLRSRAAFREFERAARELGAPAGSPRPAALAVVAAEVLVPLGLLAPPGGLSGFILAAGLLAVLSAALVRALRRNVATACACFGSSSAPIGPRHLVRNGALLAVAALGAGLSVAGPALPTHPGGLALAAFAALIGVLLVVGTDELAALFADPAPSATRAPATPRATRSPDAVSDRRRRDSGGAVPAEPAAHLRRRPQAPDHAR